MSVPTPSARSAARIIAATARRLSEASIERAQAEARALVRQVTGRREEDLVLHPEAPLSETEVARVEELTARRAAREPLPYVLGWVEFYSLRFHISPAAIVPRPETEILVEAASRCARTTGADLIAEVGVGSGAVAIAMACEVPSLRIVATDISLPALRLAAENRRLHGLQDRVYLVCCDLLSGVAGRLDGIVANLPYIARDEFENLDPEVRDYEPRLALNGGSDGLGLLHRLALSLCDHLNKGGFTALEVGAGQAHEVANLLRRVGLEEVEILADYSGIERVVLGWRRG